MGRIAVCMMVALAMASMVFAQGETDDINRSIQSMVSAVKRNPEVVSQVWGQVSGVSAVQAAELLDGVNAAATAPQSMETLSKLHSELGRQTAAFKAAYGAMFSSRSASPDDTEDLYAQVIEDKAHADPKLLEALSKSYETLYVQMFQLMMAQNLAGNKGGLATFQNDDGARSADAAKVASSAEEHVTAYRANIAHTLVDLKGLLNVESARR